MRALTFGEVSAALALNVNVSATRQGAFIGRLKHYQRNGFPAGLNSGRGVAAVYNVGHAIQLALALELNQLGLTPERASAVVKDDLPTLAYAVLRNMTGGSPSKPDRMVFYIDPHALSDLSDHVSEVGVNMTVDTEENLVKNLKKHGFYPRFSVLSATSLIVELLGNLTKSSGVPAADLLIDLLDWAEEIPDADDPQA